MGASIPRERYCQRPDFPVDLTLYDLLKSIYVAEFAIDGRFEVSKGPWGVLIDGVYFRANQTAMAQKSINIPILDPPPFTIQGRADVTGVYSVGESALSYDVYASPCLVANMPELTVGILGGARYTYFRTVVDLEVSGSGPLGLTRTFQSDKTAAWVDPFVGWRVLWRPSEKWTTSIKTEFGGFGVGSAVMRGLGDRVETEPIGQPNERQRFLEAAGNILAGFRLAAHHEAELELLVMWFLYRVGCSCCSINARPSIASP